MTHERVATLAVWLFLVAGGSPALAQDKASEEVQPSSDQSQTEQLAAAPPGESVEPDPGEGVVR